MADRAVPVARWALRRQDNWQEPRAKITGRRVVPIESIGLLHPGEMGAGIGAVLVRSGYRVTWASSGRREQSVERARVAGLVDVESVAAIRERSDLVVSVCPPHA